MSEKRASKITLMWDILSVLPGWLFLVMISWWAALIVGIPVAALLVATRRTWWQDHLLPGCVAIGVLEPVLSLILTVSFVFKGFGLLAGLILGAAVLAAAELWNRRNGRSLVLHFPMIATLALLALGSIFNYLLLDAQVITYPTEDFTKALGAAQTPPEWTAEAKNQAAEAVRTTVSRNVQQEDEIAHLHRELSATLRELAAARSPHGAYVTLFEPYGYRARGFSKEGSDTLHKLIRATVDAVSQRPRRPRATRTKSKIWTRDWSELRIQIDIPGPSRKLTYRPIFHLFTGLFRNTRKDFKDLEPLSRLFDMTYDLEPGLDGIEIHAVDLKKTAIMLPAEPITEGWLTPTLKPMPVKARDLLRRTWTGAHKEALDLTKDRFAVRKFKTLSFGEPVPGKVVTLHRGNVLLEGDLTRALLVERMILAVDWLSRQVKEDGSFHYEMMPPYKKETKSYNLPRHAGTVYSLFAFANGAQKEPAFAEAGARALDAGLKTLAYIGENLKSPDPEKKPDLLCFMEQKTGQAKSGSAALAALALVEMPLSKTVKDADLKSRIDQVPIDKWISGIGKCMLEMIDPRGRVFRYYAEAQKEKYVKKEPLYFPGEVMLALVRMYKRVGDEAVLEGAERIANRQLRRFSFELFLGIPRNGDHWIMQALSELAQVTGNHDYARLSVLMGRGYIREQHEPHEYLYADYRGAYRRVANTPRTTRAASRGEAVGASMYAADLIGADPTKFERSLIEGARHLLEQQFVPENSYYIPKDYDVLGAIRMGLTDNHCRIDNNQHALVGLFRALEAMDRRAARK